MKHDALAQALLHAVRARQFEATPDAMRRGAPLAHFPSIDLAVIAFPAKAPPVWANVLFSRDHPAGLVATIGGDAGAVSNVAYLADRTDAQLRSHAWFPDADWSKLDFLPLAGAGAHRFVAPYPASLIKLMVAVGVLRLVDQGRCSLDEPLRHEGQSRSVAAWAEAMIAVSDNPATTALVALLHARRAIVREGDHETDNALHEAFAERGLTTLRLASTRTDGGWGNGAGSGVGHLQMTAWDSARLLWLLDRDAPAAPWLAARTPALLSERSRAQIRAWLDAQTLQILFADAPRGAHFAHKTGTTENYASDAGIVRGIAPRRRHYIVAMTSNLGTRYGKDDEVTPRLAALGAAVDAALAAWLEGSP